MGSQSLCYVNGFGGTYQFNKVLELIPMSMGLEGIPDEKGSVIGCESRIPFKVSGLKRILIVYAVDSSGQSVDRREIVKDSKLWEHICNVMGLSRTWLMSEVGFMDKPLKSVSFCDEENGQLGGNDSQVIDNVYDDVVVDYDDIDMDFNDTTELRHDDVKGGLESSHVVNVTGDLYSDRNDIIEATFTDDDDDNVNVLNSRFADLLDGDDRVPGVRYVGKVSEVIPGQYRFVEARNHRQPKNFMEVSDPEASARLSDRTCLKPDGLYAEIAGDMDNDDLNDNVTKELDVEDSEVQLSEMEYADSLFFKREHMIRTLMKSLLIFSNESHRNDYFYVTEMKVRAICEEAYIYGDTQFGIKEAQNWANDFTIPEDMVESDRLEFQQSGWDFDQMVENRLNALRGNRLNPTKIEGTLSRDNPEWDVLMELATVGMDLCLPDDYEPNSATGLPKLAKSYKETHTAVNRMIVDNFCKKGLAMVFNLDDIKEHVPVFSLAVARWAEKKNKECGRNIHDATARQKGQNFCLNNKFSTQACKDKYGTIYNPTVQDVILMVFAFWEREKKANPNVKWEDLRLWKMDLAGAFTLLNFRIDCVKHVGLELWGGLVVFFLCGVFGWTGTPGCFQVVNRALMFEAKKLLYGMACMFCDDVMGVCWKDEVDSEIATMRRLIISLMGDGSVADHKTESGVSVVILGYLVDLKRGFVAVASHNLYKALYGFLELEVEELVSFVQVERLASWGSRYGLVCVHMNPLVRILYRELKGRQRNHKWYLSDACKVAIWFFRTLFCLAHIDGVGYCRPLWSLRSVDKWLWIAEFDACLSGIGCIWYSVSPEGYEQPVGAGSWNIESMGFGDDASYQNTAEFMGAILSLVGIIRYQAQGKAFLLRGDSKSALSWADKKRIRGDLAVPASFLFNYIWVYYRVMLAKCEHLAAELNMACDGLSRQFLCDVVKFRRDGIEDMRKPRHKRKYRHNYTKVGDRSKCNEIDMLMVICDPRQVWETEEDFGRFWRRMVKWCNLVLGKPPKAWTPADFESELAITMPLNNIVVSDDVVV